MITGNVNWFLEAIVTVEVQNTEGDILMVQCLLDTGFDGDLALPSATIRSLGLEYVGPSETTLLDSHSLPLPTYDGIVKWHGQTIRASVLETHRDAVIGMGLLENSTLTVQVWDGGAVLIEPRQVP